MTLSDIALNFNTDDCAVTIKTDDLNKLMFFFDSEVEFIPDGRCTNCGESMTEMSDVEDDGIRFHSFQCEVCACKATYQTVIASGETAIVLELDDMAGPWDEGDSYISLDLDDDTSA